MEWPSSVTGHRVFFFFWRPYSGGLSDFGRWVATILTEFHPVAGRIQENSLVDCNDAGAEFIEARVHARLTQIIKEPKMEELKQFLPVETLSYQTEKAILSVKITFFDCGGIAVGVCLSHKIADGTSLVAFMNAWAATCRDQVIGPEPRFDMAAHFPPMDLSGASGFTPSIGVTKDKITTKRFVFDEEKLSKLKQLAGGDDVKNPTRVEAVSAFIWRHFIDAAKAKAKLLLGDDIINKLKTSSFVAVHAVNMRPRANPQIPEHAFGNCWRPGFAFLEDDCDIVNKLRDAIREIDEGYVNKVQNGEYLRLLSKSVDLVKGDDVEICNFSSWCRFPMYEVDFGWGKPVWVCTTTLPFKNLVILMSTPCGGGIEAWVNVPHDELNMLQTHYDLLGSVTWGLIQGKCRASYNAKRNTMQTWATNTTTNVGVSDVDKVGIAGISSEHWHTLINFLNSGKIEATKKLIGKHSLYTGLSI
ncbi:hypothetical protein DH2020_019042 [Rehmannia glutinosa]|uniref:Vinorine synthase n=1 Tax=Rehmannia glutinosa TaxID=99300 RepID=A0ABR0WLU8_REHGL